MTSRPAFDTALERARKGESGGIIVHDLTRFGRYDTMAKDIIALEESGAMFISCAEKIDTALGNLIGYGRLTVDSAATEDQAFHRISFVPAHEHVADVVNSSMSQLRRSRF